MLEVLIGFSIFLIGFALGVFERKVDRLKVNKLFFDSTGSEVLRTPTQEEMKLKTFEDQFKV